MAEIRRITSSLRPAGMVSASMSVTKPALYSAFVMSSRGSTLMVSLESTLSNLYQKIKFRGNGPGPG